MTVLTYCQSCEEFAITVRPAERLFDVNTEKQKKIIAQNASNARAPNDLSTIRQLKLSYSTINSFQYNTRYNFLTTINIFKVEIIVEHRQNVTYQLGNLEKICTM